MSSGTNPVPGGSEPVDREPLDREQRDAFAARMLGTLTGGAVHDQHSPEHVLRQIRAALTPGGVFLMVDAKFATDLAGNVGNPQAALCYPISLRYCVPVSLAGGGAGLGAMWGTELARDMLTAAGFGQVEVVDSPRPQNCIYICRP